MELRNTTFLILSQKGNKFDNSMICFPFSGNLAPLTFLPWSPAYTWNCMAPLSSFSPSIWRLDFSSLSPGALLALETTWHPSRPFSVNLAPLTFSSLEPLLALETACASLVLFPVNLAPLTFSSLEPLLTLEMNGATLVLLSVNWRHWRFLPWCPACTWTAWRPSHPFLRQFGAPDVFFPGATAWTWNCMAPLSSYWFNFLSFLLPLSSLFSFLFPSFPLFSPSLSFPFLFSFFWRPFGDLGGPGPPSPPPRYAPVKYLGSMMASGVSDQTRRRVLAWVAF